VGEWKFDETTGTVAYDATGGNSNGTLTNGPTRATSTCKIANCLSFNGASDYVNIPYRPTFRNALTSSIWIKRTTDFNQLADVMFLSPPNAWYFYDSYNSGNIHGDVFIDSVRRGATNVSVPYDGNWYHMVYTYDSATHFSKMYKNGVLAASVEITGLSNYLIDSATGNLARLGSQALGRGMILDDARIYNRALSATEVAQLYNSQVFSRYFYVENVCRISDSSGNIASSTTPCPNGTADDPLTQKVTAITQWTFGAGADQVSLSRYLSRWGNFSIRQSDWSGGSGQNGVITSPNSLYSTSTNITATDTLGSFEILNLSQ